MVEVPGKKGDQANRGSAKGKRMVKGELPHEGGGCGKKAMD